MSIKTIKAIVNGKVQGVCFRASTKQFADSHELTGYAKNLANGDVEVEATGQELTLIKLTEFLEQGPVQAEVLKVSWDYIQEKPFDEFLIL